MFNKHTIELPREIMTDSIDPIAVLAQETEQWNDLAEEGQLAIDVMQTTDSLIIISAMAGTKPEHVNLHLQDDLLTIRGVRESPLIERAQRSISWHSLA
jgi:HSP20 family molecular chaperone IbpA